MDGNVFNLLQYTDTLYITQKEINLTNSLLQDITIFKPFTLTFNTFEV